MLFLSSRSDTLNPWHQIPRIHEMRHLRYTYIQIPHIYDMAQTLHFLYIYTVGPLTGSMGFLECSDPYIDMLRRVIFWVPRISDLGPFWDLGGQLYHHLRSLARGLYAIWDILYIHQRALTVDIPYILGYRDSRPLHNAIIHAQIWYLRWWDTLNAWNQTP